MNPKLLLGLALVLSGSLFACARGAAAPGRIGGERHANLQDILDNIEKQVPELASESLSTGGKDNSEASFFLRNHPRYPVMEGIPKANDSVPLVDLNVSIARYASPADAQKAMEEDFQKRSVAPPPEINYQHTALYRYTNYNQEATCQAGPYLIEIVPYSESAMPLTMKVLDKVLAGLNSSSAQACETIAVEAASTNAPQIKIVGPPIKVAVELVTPGKSSTLTAKRITCAFEPRPKTRFAAYFSSFAMLEIHDPATGKICFVDANDSFYMADSSGTRGFTVFPFVLDWSGSYIEMSGAMGDDFALAQFERNFSVEKFNQEWNARRTNRIDLRQATPRFYFSDAPAPGGALPMPVVEAVGLTNGILRLDICNPSTKVPASFWIDLKAERVMRSVVNGEEMDLSAVGTFRPYAVPLKKN